MFNLDININCRIPPVSMRYLSYFLYEIVDNFLMYCILDLTMYLNLKFIMQISILMVNFSFHIFEAFYNA